MQLPSCCMNAVVSEIDVWCSWWDVVPETCNWGEGLVVCISLGIWNLSLEPSRRLQTCVMNFSAHCHVDKAIYNIVHHADHVKLFSCFKLWKLKPDSRIGGTCSCYEIVENISSELSWRLSGAIRLVLMHIPVLVRQNFCKQTLNSDRAPGAHLVTLDIFGFNLTLTSRHAETL